MISKTSKNAETFRRSLFLPMLRTHMNSHNRKQ